MKFTKFAICLFSFSVVTQITGVKCHPKNYKEVLASLKYKDRLLFDITRPVKEGLLNIKTTDLVDWEGLRSLGVQMSPILYINLDQCDLNLDFLLSSVFEERGSNNDLPEPLYSFTENVLNTHPPSVSLFFGFNADDELMNMTYPLTPETIATFLNYSETTRARHFTVIFSSAAYYNHRTEAWYNPYTTLPNVIRAFKLKWRHVKIGLELKDRSLYSHVILRQLNLVDLVVLNVDIPLAKFMLTYPEFKTQLRKTLDKKYEFIRRANSYCPIYAKLNFLSGRHTQFELPSTLSKKYYYYLLLYSVSWLNDNEYEGIILNPYSHISALQDDLSGEELSYIISAHLYSLSIHSSTCEMKAIIDHITPNLKSISVSTLYVNDLLQNIAKCILTKDVNCVSNSRENEVCKRPLVNAISFPDIIIEEEIIPPLEEVKNLIEETLIILHDLPLKKIEFHSIKSSLTNQTIIGETEEYILEKDFFPKFMNNINGLSSGISLACNVKTFRDSEDVDVFPNDRNFIQGVRNSCSYMWNESDYVVWSFDFSTESDLESLTSKLLNIEVNRQQFVQQFPPKYVKLKIYLSQENLHHFESMVSLYCRQDVLALNEKADVVINFARIHNISLDIKPVLDVDYAHGWYSFIRTVSEVDFSKTGFAALTARNYPEHFLCGSFITDPCIAWANSAPTGRLVMDPEYSGTTLHMRELKSSPLGNEEMETLLVFALHKFSLVEIVPESVSDVITVLTTLSSREFVNNLAVQENKPARIYIQMDCNFLNTNKLSSDHFKDKLKKLVLVPVGIHWKNWKNCSSINELFLGKLAQNMTIQGISMEDCVEEVNVNFINLRKFKQLDRIRYLVCNIKHPQELSNRNKFEMERYLDTTLYITKYFQRIFPDEDKQILFRLNPVPLGPGFDYSNDEQLKMTEFFKFFADVNEYARAYNIKIFMLPAFDDEQLSRIGWWKILNRESLTNTSVFIEKESEYHGKDPWRPSIIAKDGMNWTQVAFIALGVTIALLIAAMMLLRFQYQRRFALLSRKEVNEFKYGTYMGDDSKKDHTMENMKFPKEFEIPRSRFVLLNTIGSGNFGLIYNATLSTDEGDLSVAVKIPKPNCPKETFKTMLSELKVLCYVGSHPHVLEFIGAYVREIGKGITYIATELCENGSLLEYLRKIKLELHIGIGITNNYVNLKQSNQEDNQEISKLSFYELCRFSHEIALGMEYISYKKIVHGDLSTRNVLLNSDLRCKIGDFGLSRKLYEYQEYIKKNAEPLPWRWLAIESLKRMEFTIKSDVWSYGITIWEIFSLGNDKILSIFPTGKSRLLLWLMDFEFNEIVSYYAGSIPYPGLSWTVSFVDELENGLRMAAPKFSSDEINEKMANCWDQIPENRPTFTELAQVFRMSRDAHYTEVMDTNKLDHSNDKQGNLCETPFTLNHR